MKKHAQLRNKGPLPRVRAILGLIVTSAWALGGCASAADPQPDPQGRSTEALATYHFLGRTADLPQCMSAVASWCAGQGYGQGCCGWGGGWGPYRPYCYVQTYCE
jgi:hypothetical protein